MFLFCWTRTCRRARFQPRLAGVMAADLSVKLSLLILISGISRCRRAEVKMLDMAPYAIDDIFSGCRVEMIRAVTKPDGLLQKELKARKDFEEMWRSNAGTCGKQILGATPYHLAILQAYGNSNTNFRKTFNQMVYSKGGNVTTYIEDFPFKSLHFLLTDVLRLIRNGKMCHRVYYGTTHLFKGEVGTEIRLGRFLQAKSQESSEIEVVEMEGRGTVFDITSCSVVNVENYTCTSEEIEHLISPFEVFRLLNIRSVTNEDADYQVITLKHSRFLSNHNCSLFSRSCAHLKSCEILVLLATILLTVLLLKPIL